MLRTPVLRHGMPCLWLKDCHVAALLAMTQNRGVLIWKTDVFHFLRLFFAQYRSASSFKRVSFRKLLRFPAKPTRFVIARRARAPDAAIFNEAICHSETKYGCTKRNRSLKIKKEEAKRSGESMFFVIGILFCFVLPCFAAGCHTSNFKIAAAAPRPRNDTKSGRFWGKIACLEGFFDTLKRPPGLG